MSIAGICELVLETDDVDGLWAFYEQELGLRELLAEDEDRVWLRAGKRCRLGIWSPGEKEYSASRGLSEPKGQGQVDGGFGGRPSVTTKALGAWDGMLRTIGRG